MPLPESRCWVCNNTEMLRVKSSDVTGDLKSQNFSITDYNYGVTDAIDKCQTCGFLQCSNIEDVLKYYVDMDDEDYESTRTQRALQAKKLVNRVVRYKACGDWLDVGAGSGILVEQAQKRGFNSVGIEPSVALCDKARVLNLPVVNGVLPHVEIGHHYDVVTLIDIVEHVTDPYSLILAARAAMSDDGVCIVVVPDVQSMAARVMGWRWWHYRIAHVGYFDQHNMTKLLNRGGLEVVNISRPSWYFPVSYLLDRVLSYVPVFSRLSAPKALDNITIPLNLYDSLCFVCKKSHAK